MHFPAKPVWFRREALTETSAAREQEGRCRQYIAQQDGADGAGLPCPEDGAAQFCCRDAECQCLG